MATTDRIILCGGVPTPQSAKPEQITRLDLDGNETNVDLEITDITRRLSSDVPDVLVDLVEIASYVYCADQAVTRGGEGALVCGDNWRRHFRFNIPVRLPRIWTSPIVVEALRKTLAVLSDDSYDFPFQKRLNPTPMQKYLRFVEGDWEGKQIDEVMLFSGGVDSLGGAVHESVLNCRRVALVSHRSSPKIFSRQRDLVKGLHKMCATDMLLHVPIWVHQRGVKAREYTQRTRTFLYASLAFAVARSCGLKRVRFYENGVIGLNLPISEQAVGSRSTRTTHRQVLAGFAELFSCIAEESFAVENPFLWLTKTSVVNLIGDAGCGHLIEQSVSCMHTYEQTLRQPHCGRCSQCVSSRFATLASRFADCDPPSLYKADLLTAERFKDKDLTLVESFIRKATDVGSMNEIQLVENYGEISWVLRHLRPLSSDEVAQRVVQLHREHASEVTKVMDTAIRNHATEIREGRLPPTCAIILAFPESYRVSVEHQCTEPWKDVLKETKRTAPTGASHASRTPGRPPNAVSNQIVARVVRSFGPKWRERLPEVCEALDKENVPLSRSPKWKRKGCSAWSDVLDEDEEGLVKALRHRLDWVEENPSFGLEQPLG